MVVTVKGKTFPVQMFHKMYTTDEIMIVYRDERTFAEIAADWEGAETIDATDEKGETTSFEGFSALKRMLREEGKKIQVVLTTAEVS